MREARFESLRQLDVRELPPGLQEVVKAAASACHAPVALAGLIERDRERVLAECGVSAREIALDRSVGAVAIAHGGLFVVPDLAADPRFAGMILRCGDRQLRFYAGSPIVTSAGVPIGMLSVLDSQPRPHGLTEGQAVLLPVLARQIALNLELCTRESELEQGQASLISFFNRVPVGLLQTSLEGRIAYLNRAYASLLGRPEREAFGELLERFVHPDDVAAHRHAIERAMIEPEPVTLERRFVGPDGTIGWASDQVSVTRSPDGVPLNVVFVARDITERLRITAELAASERKFRTIADTMPQMVWSTLPDGSVDYYNQRWYDFTGVDQGAHDGDAWNEALHPEDREQAAEVWQRSVVTGAPYEIEYRLRHASGEHRWVLARALPVRNAVGEVERWFGTCTDIEEIKQAEEARDLLAHELSHRIKNIFAVVSGLVSLTARGEPATQPFAKSLRERLNALSLAHEYVRPGETGVGTYGEVRSVFGLLRTLLRPYVDEGHEPYRFSGVDAEIGAKTATALALVMHEQATNAVKYGALSRESGEVCIEGSTEGDAYVLKWREQGGPPLDGAPARRGFGTDMAARSAAGQLGGQIDHSWDPEGLTVTLTIPTAMIVR